MSSDNKTVVFESLKTLHVQNEDSKNDFFSDDSYGDDFFAPDSFSDMFGSEFSEEELMEMLQKIHDKDEKQGTKNQSQEAF
ncbi:7918_t:CDS:2 [Diversispora eburnea]|uniref:7918_t:CDS:1 n=1 Tax=Diversispora eburnea TaxID=1213867 RepID=A0A9N9BGX5_9GLOM|nr:7918_t:CDS:2 [Diversispora eburnea]